MDVQWPHQMGKLGSVGVEPGIGEAFGCGCGEHFQVGLWRPQEGLTWVVRGGGGGLPIQVERPCQV